MTQPRIPGDGHRCKHGMRLSGECDLCAEYFRGRAEAFAEAVAAAEAYARDCPNYDDDEVLSKGVPDALRELK